MDKRGRFILGDADSQDYGIILTKAPPVIFAQRDVSTSSVAGRSGDLTYDLGRYKNVTVSYECAIIPERGRSLRETAIAALALLRPSPDYKQLKNTFFGGSYRMARISSNVSVESVMERAGRFTINFDCKPQRFLVSGELPVMLNTAGALRNPSTETSKPLITVRGSGAGTLTVGEVTVDIKSMTDHIILDSDIENAYINVEDGSVEYVNTWISAPKFPELLPGDNEISWTGGISEVSILPRWWTL